METPLSPANVDVARQVAPRVLGLTGGIGSGKSTARNIFETLGIPTIDSDEVARSIHQNPSHPAMAALAGLISQSVSADGRLRRGSLRNQFATDREANQNLKQVLKPFVIAETENWTRRMNGPYVVWESALMVEEHIPCDRLLVIDAPKNIRVARILDRNPDWTEAQIENILSLQLDSAAYISAANDLLCNDGSLADLRKQIEELHRSYMKNWS